MAAAMVMSMSLDVDRRIVVAVGPSWAGPRGRWE